MARAPFSPPQVDPELALPSKPAGLPSRSRGAYQPWEIAAPLPEPAPPPRPAAPSPPAGPDPLELAFAQAQRDGWEAGLEAAEAQAQAAVEAELQRLRTSVEEALQLRAVLAEVYRHEMVELAVTVAEALVQDEMRQNVDRIRSLVARALAALGPKPDLRLTLHPLDAERLRPWLDALEPAIAVREREALSVGDLRLESQAGSVESLMQERIARVRQLVLGELAAEASE